MGLPYYFHCCNPFEIVIQQKKNIINKTCFITQPLVRVSPVRIFNYLTIREQERVDRIQKEKIITERDYRGVLCQEK